MRKLVSLFAGLMLCSAVFGQDFSNKGKEFWISYPAHIDNTSSTMGVYITSDVAASGTVTVGGTAVPFTVAANSVVRIFIGASGAVQASNASVYLSTQDGTQTGAGIHVTSDKPVAVYAHIIRTSRSGATLVLPVNVWGKEYLVPSYKSTGTQQSFGEINVMAAEANTVVEITPAITSRNGLHPGGTAFTITLTNPGDVYQLQFPQAQDISGTRIKSIANGTSGCKPIGVYSATTWSGFDCSGASGGDNLYQQLFPISAWGKNFLTAPFSTRNYDIVRVFVNDPTTVVTRTMDGVSTVLTPTTFGYYEYKTNPNNVNIPSRITADKPVSVIQYITSQSCGYGNSAPADPEMVVLNPVEQTINNITVFSAHQNYVPSGQSAVNACYLNIIIQTAAAASFKINNAPPSGTFVQIPGTAYSYLQENVTTITLSNPVQTLKADSAFSAIAYGFGQVESYGYNAGTNVKDLFQHIVIQNQYATVDFPTTCVNTPFSFAITLPYQAQSLSWDFHGAFTNVNVNAPVPDSSYVIDNRTVYVYRLPNTYNFSAIGTYPVTVTAINPTSDGCSGTNQIDYDVEVLNKPNVSFYYNHTGCISDTARFHDTTNTGGRPIIHWNWQFGDNTTATGKDTVHLYQASGTYPVKLNIVTDVGCIADTTIPITISAAPIARFGASMPQCAGTPVVFTDSSTIASGNIIKWYWDYGNGQRDTVTNNSPRTVTYTAAGTYAVKLTVEGAGGCKSLVFTRNVVIRSKPTVDFSLPSICQPAGVGQFTSTVSAADSPVPTFTYNWNFGDGGSSTLANPSHQFTGSGPFSVHLTVTSSYGCIGDTTKQLTTVYPQPSAVFTAPAEVCLNDSAAFTDQSTAINSSVAKWHWDFGDGRTDTVQNPKHLYLTSGTFTVKLYTQSAAGCNSDTASKTIIVNALPVANFTIGSAACAGQNITFTSTSTTSTGTIDSLRWNFGDNTTLSTINTPAVHTYSTAGTYSATLQVVSSKGCVSPVFTKSVVVKSSPAIDFTLPVICQPAGTGQFTSTVTTTDTPVPTYTYLWNFGDGGTSTNANPVHQFAGTGPFAVKLSVTSSSGCKSDTTKLLTSVYAQPRAQFAAPAEVCLKDSAAFTDQSTAANSTIVKWHWDFGDGGTDTVQNPKHAYLISGVRTVKLYTQSVNGCKSDTASRTITVNALPTASFTVSNPNCISQSITFTGTSNPGAGTVDSLKWTFGDNTSLDTTRNPVVHVYSSATAYNATLQIVSSKGCRSTAVQQSVNVHVLPVANFGLPQVCLSDPFAEFTDSSTISDGTAAAFTYLWNFGDANSTPSNPNISNIKNARHRYTTAGNYTVTLTVTSGNGCSTTATKQITINGSIPAAAFNVQNAGNICGADSVILQNKSTVDFGNITKTEIFWDFANNPTVKETDSFPVFDKLYPHLYTTFSAPSQQYTIKFNAYSGGICVSSVQKTITVYPNPVAAIGKNTNEVCQNKSIIFTDNSTNTGLNVNSWNWQFGDGGTGTTQSVTHTYRVANTFTIQLQNQTADGCKSPVVTTQVRISPIPTVDAGPNITLLEGGQAQIKATASGSSGYTYVWTPGTWLSSTTELQPITTPLDSITYKLTVTGTGNCSASDEVKVIVLKGLVIPNAFSPNGDGINDKWVIEFLESYPGAIVNVYDRYGQIVFTSKVTGYVSWDGTFNGKPLPIGTYYYVIDPKNGRQATTGSVTILR